MRISRHSGFVHASAALLLSALALACGNSPSHGSGADTNSGGSGASSAGGAGGSNTGGSGGSADTTGGTGGSAESVGGAGGSGGSGASGGSGGSTGLPPNASAGCGKAATAGFSDVSIETDEGDRAIKIYVTAGYSPDEPVSLVFGFHGNGGNADQGASFGIQTAAEAAGDHGVFIFPNGSSVQGGFGWAMGSDEKDVAYFDTLVAYAEENFCIDKNRIFVSGFSWGCDFSNALGCYRGDVIRGVQCYSGAFYSFGCTEETPAYRVSYSTPDGTDAYSEDSMFNAVEHYSEGQGCSETTQSVEPSPCLAYDGCTEPVIYCPYPSLGHSVPGTAGTDTWAFFSSLP
jgi:polyhydroxybutyrate depolymerase